MPCDNEVRKIIVRTRAINEINKVLDSYHNDRSMTLEETRDGLEILREHVREHVRVLLNAMETDLKLDLERARRVDAITQSWRAGKITLAEAEDKLDREENQ